MNFADPDVRLARAKELLLAGRALITSEIREFAKQGQKLAFRPEGLQDALEFRSYGYDLMLKMCDQLDAERIVRRAAEDQLSEIESDALDRDTLI